MLQKKRPFYIIAHRSNTIDDARNALDLGANALEFDICHHEGTFYVCHSDPLIYEDIPTVAEYLDGLNTLLTQNDYNLALAIFDLKDNDFDINELVSLIKQYISGSKCDGMAILLTHADDVSFITTYTGQYPDVGVGVDESNIPPAELEGIFKKAGQQHFSYADGITTFLSKPGVFTNITTAQTCAFQNAPESYKLIYTWVLTLEGSMCKYLDTYIDGIFVDPPYIEKLKDLVTSHPYNGVYELARHGHNPYTVPRIPAYRLRIKTRDTFLAGSAAFYVFTLKGSAGTLQSLPFNSHMDGRLDSGTLTYVALEGLDIGEVQSLTVQALTSNVTSDWLPEIITVESNCLAESVDFIFNDDVSPNEWVSEKTGAVTRSPLS
ncbi:hypothetical protein GCM10023189_40110 [Nibrella saemangeumensis]|uniref:PLAT domain-containing protein n=1 Tax=Nibrella saemangeumensis TaxID=1084526 RepID=A0ABP8NAZ5_9BACT